MNKTHVVALIVALGASTATAAERLTLPAPDVAAVLAADGPESKSRPWRFAAPIPVQVTPATHGVWTTVADSQRWRLLVSIPGAQHLNFGFTQFNLPGGAALTVTAPDGSDRRGPYGSRGSGQLWTPVIRGDQAVVELSLPAGTPRAAAALALTRVNYGFRGFGAKDENTPKSGACNVDVACSEGDEWRDEIRSVARYTINGALLCTGTLLNNTARDFRPLFLTAAHCITTPADALGTVFYWNYETSECGARPNGQLTQTQSGAMMLATSAKADFSLMVLDAAPDPAFRVYYAGWDNRDEAWADVTCIHHPSGDEKRIARYFGATEVTGTGLNLYSAPGDPEHMVGTAANPVFLMVKDWDRGVTEGGSSGSALWNAEHRVVGQLSGGGAACSGANDNGAPDWYGRVHKDWFDLPTPLTSLATHLDPAGTGAEFVDGVDPNPDAASARSGSGLLVGGGLPLFTLAMLLGAVFLRRRIS